MKSFLLVFFISTLFFLTNVKDANAACTATGTSTTIYTLPFTLNKGCLGSPTTYTLPFSTEYGTYYTLPATISYYYGVACTDTWVCDTCYDTCCASCCNSVGHCGGTCTGCASGPFAGCNPTNYDVWNASRTCYCSYCAIYYSCAPCVSCNPYSCNCRWVCI